MLLKCIFIRDEKLGKLSHRIAAIWQVGPVFVFVNYLKLRIYFRVGSEQAGRNCLKNEARK